MCGPVAGCPTRCPTAAFLSAPSPTVPLVTPEDVLILKLAADRYRYEAMRLQDAKALFGLGPARFWQKVNALIEDPAVIAAHPGLALPLRRQREQQGRLKRAV